MAHLCTQLGSQDISRFRQLMSVFADAFDDAQAYQGAPPSDAYVQRLLAKPTFIVLTAEVEGAVVGGLVAYVLEKFERERSEVYIYDLAVAAAHRRQGIARDLILLLKRIAADLGAYVIYVQADLVDDPAIQLYTSLGKREDVLHFDIDIDVDVDVAERG
jgi:aminoglycoside 3-N-acetyltransferase I